MTALMWVSGMPEMIARNVPSTFRNTPIFRMPPVATRIPVNTRRLRLNLTWKNSGTVISCIARSRLTMNPVRPMKIMTSPAISPLTNEA